MRSVPGDHPAGDVESSCCSRRPGVLRGSAGTGRRGFRPAAISVVAYPHSQHKKTACKYMNDGGREVSTAGAP